MTETTKKKKGQVHYKKDKMRNPELSHYDGCAECIKSCVFNSRCVHPDESFNDEAFLCNSTRKEK